MFGAYRYAGAMALAATLVSAGHAAAREIVPFNSSSYRAGAIVIRNSERALYLVRGDSTALRYRVAVGRPGKQWLGTAYVKGKYVRPSWSPPAEVLRDKPSLPKVIAGGSPKNPMGPRAILLDRQEIAIHGTNRPKSIGTFASYGCIRMRNVDILDLYERVSVGDKVVVIP